MKSSKILRPPYITQLIDLKQQDVRLKRIEKSTENHLSVPYWEKFGILRWFSRKPAEM